MVVVGLSQAIMHMHAMELALVFELSNRHLGVP